MDLDLKILRMNRLGVLQQTISIHLQKMPELAKLVNTDLSKGFGDGNHYYFRTRNGAEIDIILEGPFGTLPIEIKFGSAIKTTSDTNIEKLCL